MDITTKIQAFEYFLAQILEWGKTMVPVVPLSSFTRLKALKLLFFTAAVRNDEGVDLLDVFDNFHALPNGPVESDVYNYITADKLTFYTFRNFSLGLKQPYSDVNIPVELKNRLDVAVDSVKKKNVRMVYYTAGELVDLSHLWMSWQSSIRIANALGKGSYKMDVNKIRSNTQIFSL